MKLERDRVRAKNEAIEAQIKAMQVPLLWPCFDSLFDDISM